MEWRSASRYGKVCKWSNRRSQLVPEDLVRLYDLMGQLTIRYGDLDIASPRSATRISTNVSRLAALLPAKSGDNVVGTKQRPSATNIGLPRDGR